MRRIQRHLEDHGDDDRISRLPTNVTELILGYLPLRDAARTSILSTNWRYLWVDLPSLVLDKKFWADIKQHKLSSVLRIDFSAIVSRILLQHTGNVEKFVIDISVIRSSKHCEANLWLSVLSRKCVKVLSIVNSESNPFTLPSCVFSAPKLINLSISNCIMEVKEINPSCFIRLQSLCLDHITLDSCVLVTPCLTSLTLDHCLGVRGFYISAPTLESLTLRRNDDLNLMPYLVCTNIIYAYICENKCILEIGDAESINLANLLSSWPKLTHFTVDGSCLEYLTIGIRPTEFSLSLVLKLTHFWALHIALTQTDWIIIMMGHSPFLQTVEVWLKNDDMFPTSYVPPLITTTSLDIIKKSMTMEQLHTVKIDFFNGSRIALIIVSIVLYCAPKLKRMLIGLGVNKNSISVSVSKELMRLQRAYPKVEIIVG